MEDGEDSDTDTLVHNMSEGSFDKDSGLSGSSGSPQSSSCDCESGRPRSITTPTAPPSTKVTNMQYSTSMGH